MYFNLLNLRADYLRIASSKVFSLRVIISQVLADEGAPHDLLLLESAHGLLELRALCQLLRERTSCSSP